MPVEPSEELQNEVEAFQARLRDEKKSGPTGLTSDSTQKRDVVPDQAELPEVDSGPSKLSVAVRDAKTWVTSTGQKAAGAVAAYSAQAKARKEAKATEREANASAVDADTPVEQAPRTKPKPAAQAASKSAPTTDEARSTSSPVDFLKRHKKPIILGAVGAAALGLVVVGLVRFQFVTVDQGIETTLGDAAGRTVLVSKATEANPNDLIVAVLPGSAASGEEAIIMGSVFSENDETYAIYDGEVIWQIPLSDVRGIVLFAQATQLP